MSGFGKLETQVGQHYDAIVEYEVNRLTKLCPVEAAITGRALLRWIPAGARVAEIGVGGGHYSALLAQHDCSIHLIDVSQRLLEAAQERLTQARLQDQLLGVNHLSATNLVGIPDHAFNAVLLLGPLYHLTSAVERQKAVIEAARILTTDGLLFAAGINRLAYLRDFFRESPTEVIARREFHQEYLNDGKLDPAHAPPIGHAHLTTVAAFRNLLCEQFEELALFGVEAFTGPWQQQFAHLSDEEQTAWLELIEGMATTPEAWGMADHWLFVGRKRSVP